MNWLARLKKQSSPLADPTETTETLFVVSVGTPDGHIQKIEGDAPAVNDPAPDPDRWSYPNSPAMNTAEIDRFTARLARFTDRGVIQGDAECLADRLAIRDREKDDRALCLECAHLQRGRRCGNWQQSGVAIRAGDAQLAGDFVIVLQRCDGFKKDKL